MEKNIRFTWLAAQELKLLAKKRKSLKSVITSSSKVNTEIPHQEGKNTMGTMSLAIDQSINIHLME